MDDGLRVQVRLDGSDVPLRMWRWRIVDSQGTEVAKMQSLSMAPRAAAERAGQDHLDRLRAAVDSEWQDVDPRRTGRVGAVAGGPLLSDSGHRWHLPLVDGPLDLNSLGPMPFDGRALVGLNLGSDGRAENPTAPKEPERASMDTNDDAEVRALNAEADANESLQRYHEDYRTWVEAWAYDSDVGHADRRRERLAACRQTALGLAMAWLRDTERTGLRFGRDGDIASRTGLRFGPDKDIASIDELLQIAEQFDSWIRSDQVGALTWRAGASSDDTREPDPEPSQSEIF